MKLVIQRVARAACRVDGVITAAIETGLMLLAGAVQGDTPQDAQRLALKVAGLRIFEDAHGKMNRSVRDVKGGILLIPNFTLAADCRRGNRPGFSGAMAPQPAKALWEEFGACLAGTGVHPVAYGQFGAHMDLEMVCDGPVTIVLDSRDNKPSVLSDCPGE